MKRNTKPEKKLATKCVTRKKKDSKKIEMTDKENLHGKHDHDDEKETPATPQKSGKASNSTSTTMTPSQKERVSLTHSIQKEENKTSSSNLFESAGRVKNVYKIIQKSTGALGGNGYNGAIYGELTLHSMQKVIDFLVEKCCMNSSSMFIDVGSGLGKPNFHVCQDPGVIVSIGIELEEIRWQLAMQNLRSVLKHTEKFFLRPGVNFIHGDIFDVISTDPFTHIYMYDLGFPPPLQQKIAEYFNASTHAEYLVSYRPPRRVIEEYGYEVEEIGKMPTAMMGSGESHTAYFYKRRNTPAACVPRPGTSMLNIPLDKDRSSQSPMDVVCSDYFKESIELALGTKDALASHVEKISDRILNSGRPKRERKQRNMDTL